MGRARRRSRRLTRWLLMAGLLAGGTSLGAQGIALRAEGGQLFVRVPGLGLLEGATLTRLEDGRAVRVLFELEVMTAPGGVPVAHAREQFNLSYDLWEERFAVTRDGTPARSTSHLSAAAAEAWCLQNLGIPVAALGTRAPARGAGSRGNNGEAWIRLSYHVDNAVTAADEDEGMFGLRTLIDLFSRRADGAPLQRTIEAGPLRLPN
jgi:hypothetical protein